MIPFPQPLHPAVVHFPVVLLLLGTAFAVLAVFVRRWHLPLFAAILLSLGAAGAAAATFTGEQEEEKVEHAIPSAEPLLEEHADWGNRARNAGIVAAAVAMVAVAMVRKPVGGRLLSMLAACAALVAGYCVVRAGQFGGELVYQHGAGVTQIQDQTGSEGIQSAQSEQYSPPDEGEREADD